MVSNVGMPRVTDLTIEGSQAPGEAYDDPSWTDAPRAAIVFATGDAAPSIRWDR